jgi:hypothetical protein
MFIIIFVAAKIILSVILIKSPTAHKYIFSYLETMLVLTSLVLKRPQTSPGLVEH